MRKRMAAWGVVLAIGALTACKTETKEPSGASPESVQVTEDNAAQDPTAAAEIDEQDLTPIRRAYLGVLRQYEKQIRMFEDPPKADEEKETGATTEASQAYLAYVSVLGHEDSDGSSCMYYDINGDGIMELIFRCYAGEEELGLVSLDTAFVSSDMVELLRAYRIFSYDPEKDQAYEVLHYPSADLVPSLRKFMAPSTSSRISIGNMDIDDYEDILFDSRIPLSIRRRRSEDSMILSFLSQKDWTIYRIDEKRLAFSDLRSEGDLAHEYIYGSVFEFELQDGEYKMTKRLYASPMWMITTGEQPKYMKTSYYMNSEEVTKEVFEKELEDYRVKVEAVPYVGDYDAMINRLTGKT